MYYQYVGKDSVKQPNYYRTSTSSKKYTFEQLLPGKTYKITIKDCKGDATSREITIPSGGTFVDGKLDASDITVKLERRQKAHSADDTKAKSTDKLKASTIQNQMGITDYGYEYQIHYPVLKNSR